jgi:large subunit ribosomal protein L6
MSRVGKQILEIPAKTEVLISGKTVTVKGPLGELKRDFSHEIGITTEGPLVKFVPVKQPLKNPAIWGTTASHVKNMIEGVNKPFEKQLILEGVGFRSEVAGTNLKLALGFSHPVVVAIPAGLKVTAEKNVVTVSGIDKEHVGRFAAQVRSLKKPEPYKGKGFRYKTEVIRRKEGKKSA